MQRTLSIHFSLIDNLNKDIDGLKKADCGEKDLKQREFQGGERIFYKGDGEGNFVSDKLMKRQYTTRKNCKCQNFPRDSIIQLYFLIIS